MKEKLILEQESKAEEVKETIITNGVPDPGKLVDVESSGDSNNPLLIFWNPSNRFE